MPAYTHLSCLVRTSVNLPWRAGNDSGAGALERHLGWLRPSPFTKTKQKVNNNQSGISHRASRGVGGRAEVVLQMTPPPRHHLWHEMFSIFPLLLLFEMCFNNEIKGTKIRKTIRQFTTEWNQREIRRWIKKMKTRRYMYLMLTSFLYSLWLGQ